MSARTLPQDAYIGAVIAALDGAGIRTTDHTWTSDAETRGVYCHLSAVITLDPSDTIGGDPDDVPADAAWPHGLVLLWEWHTGAEEGGPERGPLWQFAALEADGSNAYPTDLPVHGYASPSSVVDAARRVIAREIGAGSAHDYGRAKWDGGVIGHPWDGADQLDAACAAWAATETAP